MDTLDDFSHLGLTDQLSLAMDVDYPCPLDNLSFSYPIISAEDKRNSTRVGDTADEVLPRLLNLYYLALSSITIAEDLSEEDFGNAKLESLVLKGLIFLRIVDLFPHQKIPKENTYGFELKRQSLVVYKLPLKSSDLKSPPPK